MVKVLISVLPVLALTGRLMSDLAFTGRLMSDLALTGRVISDLALKWPETDHNFDHELDKRASLNIKFSTLSIYEVKSDGSYLKKSIDMSLGQGRGQDLN